MRNDGGFGREVGVSRGIAVVGVAGAGATR